METATQNQKLDENIILSSFLQINFNYISPLKNIYILFTFRADPGNIWYNFTKSICDFSQLLWKFNQFHWVGAGVLGRPVETWSAHHSYS